MHNVIALDNILIGERQRQDLGRGELKELEESIRDLGLIHSIVVQRLKPEVDGKHYKLVAGERRLTAVSALASQFIAIKYLETDIDLGYIAANVVPADWTEAMLQEIELHENIMRKQISWQEKTKALSVIMEMKREENPSVTVKEVAQQLENTTGLSTERLRKAITHAEVIQRNIHRPSVAAARTEHEAFREAYKAEQKRFEVALRRKLAEKSASTSDDTAAAHVAPTFRTKILNKDLLSYFEEIPDNQFRVILTDPPYGIGADSKGFTQRTGHAHGYEDTPETARRIVGKILLEGFRVATNQAILWMFTDIDMFSFARDAASRAGWSPFRTPIIWQKSRTEGMAPWGSGGPRRTHEYILLASKNRAALNHSPPDILYNPRVARNERLHAAEKPVELLQRLISWSSVEGDTVFDPCAGSAATLVAARRERRHSFGLELSKEYFDLASERLELEDFADFEEGGDD